MTTTTPWYRRLFGYSLGWALVLPAVLLVLQVVGTSGVAFHEAEASGEFGLDWFGYLLLFAGPLLLTVRERWPVPVLLGVVGVSLLYVLLNYPYGPFIASVIVAVVHAVKARHRVIAWITFLGMLVIHFAVLTTRGEVGEGASAGAVTGWVVVVLVSAEVVRGVSERREVRARVREAEEANRLTEERLRIARELHDVVAHNISLINVQAGTALHLLDRRPEQARSALATIKQSSKDTLVELRSILGVLRQADADELGAPEQPAPGLGRLPSLVSNARQAGLTVDVRSGELGTLPDRVDLAAYRILQEAITNVIRHARAQRVWIVLERQAPGDSTEGGDSTADGVSTADGGFTGDGPSTLRLRVTDDGTGGEPDASGSRSGLLGMRERAEALGGSFRAGRRTDNDGNGFEVVAILPLPEEGAR